MTRFVLLLLLLLLGTVCVGSLSAKPPRGMPFTRTYPYEQVGNIHGGVQLTFDPHGRLTVVQEGRHLVLNDESWIDLAARKPSTANFIAVSYDKDGQGYYGAQGSWGRLLRTESGELQSERLFDETAPSWVLTTRFTRVLCTSDAVYFGGWDGVVRFDKTTKKHTFFTVPETGSLFSLNGQLYISSYRRGVQILNAGKTEFVRMTTRAFSGNAVDQAASFGEGRMIISTYNRRVSLFDGQNLTPLPGPMGQPFPARVSSLQPLDTRRAAAAVIGVGLFIFNERGEIEQALTGPEFQSIRSLASNERGVLWAATDTGILKILHDPAVTLFGSGVGLTVVWPQVAYWNGRTLVASDGRLFEQVETAAMETARFRSVDELPPGGCWGIASAGDWLLVGNMNGIFGKTPGGRFAPILPKIPVAKLVALDAKTCLVLTASEVAVIGLTDGGWKELAPRSPGAGFPYLIHRGEKAVWVELGGTRVARIGWDGTALAIRVLEPHPHAQSSWLSVSPLGDTVVLLTGNESPRFFGEREQDYIAAPALTHLLENVPYPSTRLHQTKAGEWWISHQHGVTRVVSETGDYHFDSSRYDVINEQSPVFVPGKEGEVWLAGSQSLYRIELAAVHSDPVQYSIRLVSVRDTASGKSVYHHHPADEPVSLSLDYKQRNLALRYFMGGYFYRRPPRYEVSINGRAWNLQDASSVLNLSDQPEGSHTVSVRLTDEVRPVCAVSAVRLSIAPPWHRTPWAWLVYVALGTGLLWTAVRVSLRRAQRRNRELERLVDQRTAELKEAMERLRQETRTAATLAERNRLAGEIHDSLEQGFSALMFQLESTSHLAQCPPQVQQGLSIARNMVAFSRNEVRHAVQDLHSPILDTFDLETALKHIVAQTGVHQVASSVNVSGTPYPLGKTIEHHLLRVAQEAVANAMKHAQASAIELKLNYTPEAVELKVSDNGRGFDAIPVTDGATHHFGLRSLRGRANKLGGRLDVESTVGRGTTVRLTVARPELTDEPISPTPQAAS